MGKSSEEGENIFNSFSSDSGDRFTSRSVNRWQLILIVHAIRMGQELS
jgi:hypothetical protein